MKLKRLLLILGFIGATLGIWVFSIVNSDEISCHIDNFKKGKIGNDVITPLVQGEPGALELDFRKVDRLSAVCIVVMYSYGEPYTIGVQQYNSVMWKKRACWTSRPTEMTVLGITKQNEPEWTRLKLPGGSQTYFHAVGKDCSAIPNALLKCVNDRCSF